MFRKTVNPSFTHKKTRYSRLEQLLRSDSKLLYFTILVFVISVSLVHASHAQTPSAPGEQVTLSDDLLNDPVAQDLLKKIEQTKKMIEQLKQKEFEKNQAQENLKKMRDISVEHLNQDLEEWERLWEKHSSRNSFERFVNAKPSYVQGVFWDQFEFKEQRVNAGRIAMNQILMNGGTMQEAKNAYNEAASTQRIELIEMNAQFNVKHNLADYKEQQIFNSTGQMHLSPATKVKLAEFYSDYKLQPSYMLANSDDNEHVLELNSEENNSSTSCKDGYVLVSRITTGNQACVDESSAKKWINSGVKGIVILDDAFSDEILTKIETNPGTQCEEGHEVIYHIEKSEYQCVTKSVAKEMTENNTAEIHTLVEYILNKDKQKITKDTIHEINQEILAINKEYEAKKKALELNYDDEMKLENSLARQQVLEIIQEYRTGTNLTKEDVTKRISEIKTQSNTIIEKMLQEKSDAINKLEFELKNKILEKVKGYENNPDLNVDWNYLNGTSSSSPSDVMPTENEEENTDGLVKEISTPSIDESNCEELCLNNIGFSNSLGQKLDEIKSDQVLQVTADVTNLNNYAQNFVYMVKITNDDDVQVQPTKWITGMLDPNQTFNAGLSWIPEKAGDFKATISVGTGMGSVVQMADVEVSVNS